MAQDDERTFALAFVGRALGLGAVGVAVAGLWLKPWAAAAALAAVGAAALAVKAMTPADGILPGGPTALEAIDSLIRLADRAAALLGRPGPARCPSAAELAAAAYAKAGGEPAGLDAAVLDNLDRQLAWCHPHFRPLHQVGLHTAFVNDLCDRITLLREVAAAGGESALPAVRRPVFIVGLPRSGSTLLHNLFAQDARSRSLSYHEVRYPFPVTRRGQTSPNLSVARSDIAVIKWFCPEMAAGHLPEAHEADECFWAFTEAVYPQLGLMMSYEREWLDWYVNLDKSEQYANYRRLLQLYQRESGPQEGHSFVLKSPMHSFCLDDVAAAFPDAVFVWTHRDPLKVYPSWCRLGESSRQLLESKPVDHRQLRDCMDVCLHTMVDEMLASRRKLEAAGRDIVDVYFDDLAADKAGTMRGLYEHLGWDWRAEDAERVASYLAQQGGAKRKRHRYTLERYHKTPESIEEGFKAYYEAFPGVRLREGSE